VVSNSLRVSRWGKIQAVSSLKDRLLRDAIPHIIRPLLGHSSAGRFDLERLLHCPHLIRHLAAGQGAILIEQLGLDFGAVALFSDPIAEDPSCFLKLRRGQSVKFAHAASPC
jgi:hypothetical protein